MKTTICYKVTWDEYTKFSDTPWHPTEFFTDKERADGFYNVIRVTRTNAKLYRGVVKDWELVHQSN